MGNLSTFKKGHKHSPDVINKIRKSNTGKIGFWKGKKRSLETKIKMRMSRIGKKVPISDEAKKRMSLGQKGKQHSIETRKKMSQSRKGSKCHLWKGGITPINKQIRQSVEYKIWRESVFKRDNYTCIWCGSKGVYLHPDHIKPFAYYPELRFAIDNGRTLCEPCHKTTDSYAYKAIINYKK